MPTTTRDRWRSMARRAAWLAMSACACVGLPPSPPEGAAESSSRGSSGDETTPQPASSSTAQVDADGTSETTEGATSATDGDTTQGVEPGTTTGQPVATGDGSSTGGGTGSTGASAPTCDELYGSAPGYLLCDESQDECTFSAQINGGSCSDLCTSFGATCIAAYDNGAGDSCVVQSLSDTCFTLRVTEICVCSK